MPDRRRRIPVELTEHAWSGWDRFTTRQKVSRTAVLEALGEEFAAGRTVLPKTVLDRAAEIDHERRTRR